MKQERNGFIIGQSLQQRDDWPYHVSMISFSCDILGRLQRKGNNFILGSYFAECVISYHTLNKGRGNLILE